MRLNAGKILLRWINIRGEATPKLMEWNTSNRNDSRGITHGYFATALIFYYIRMFTNFVVISKVEVPKQKNVTLPLIPRAGVVVVVVQGIF